MKNTVETLEKIQTSRYDGIIGEREQSLSQVFEYIIEKSRSVTGPRSGDLLELAGEVVHIEMVAGPVVSVCRNFYTPFISGKIDSWGNASIFTDTSGGPFESLVNKQYEYIGKKDRKFQVFCGVPRAGGAIELLATVNVWIIKI